MDDLGVCRNKLVIRWGGDVTSDLIAVLDMMLQPVGTTESNMAVSQGSAFWKNNTSKITNNNKSALVSKREG